MNELLLLTNSERLQQQIFDSNGRRVWFKVYLEGQEYKCTTLYSVWNVLDHTPFLPLHAMDAIMDWCEDPFNYIPGKWHVWAGLAYYWVDIEVCIENFHYINERRVKRWTNTKENSKY